MNQSFSYQDAFSRNVGWLTESELISLKGKKVAIAGCGGVGGHYAEVLARLGISNFVLADFDEFEVHNFNRQNGAFISNVGRKKIDVISELIKEINPEANVTKFESGVFEKDFDQFFNQVDLYLDGLDFYAVDTRIKLFNYLTI